MDQQLADREDFVVETTHATVAYAKRIPTWQTAGYWVRLIYLELPSIEASIARVRKRVASGGHDIPEATIRRRFARSRRNFEIVYKPLVDDWSIWQSRDGTFEISEASYVP